MGDMKKTLLAKSSTERCSNRGLIFPELSVGISVIENGIASVLRSAAKERKSSPNPVGEVAYPMRLKPAGKERMPTYHRKERLIKEATENRFRKT